MCQPYRAKHTITTEIQDSYPCEIYSRQGFLSLPHSNKICTKFRVAIDHYAFFLSTRQSTVGQKWTDLHHSHVRVCLVHDRMVYTHLCEHVHTCIHIDTYLYTHEHTCTHTYTHMCTHVHTHMDAHKHKDIHTD